MDINEYINNHKQINYCEAIIFKDGSIEDCIPSHQQKLIKISKESEEELMNLIPIDAGPNEWLICHNNVIALWYDFCIYNTISEQQMNSLKLLIKAKILKNPYKCFFTFEKQKIEMRNKFFNSQITADEYENFIKSTKENNKNFLIFEDKIKLI